MLSPILQEQKEHGTREQKRRSKALLEFFATSVQEVDEMAAAIMIQESCTYQDMSRNVRWLQEYELLFWNACDIAIGAASKAPRIKSAFAVTA